ncbi:hydrolase [Halobacteriales archaeon QS_8_69_26]|nr:MAG: hydrolase [Halobacteriales archaeon QS_8_69_26]
MAYDAVLFDNDGVLVRPVERSVLATAIRATFEEFGVDPPDEAVEALSFAVAPEAPRRIGNEHGIDPDALWRRRDRNASLAQRVEMVAGRKGPYDDLSAIADLDRPMGIVSSNQHATIEFQLAEFDLREWFPVAYGREPGLAGIDRKKPDPHYLERACADLGVDPADALYVGDRGSDVRAAHNAGADAAFLRRDHVADADLSADPEYEVRSLADLVGLV